MPENRDLPSTSLQDREEIPLAERQVRIDSQHPQCAQKEDGPGQLCRHQCPAADTEQLCWGAAGARCHGQSAEGMLISE